MEREMNCDFTQRLGNSNSSGKKSLEHVHVAREFV